MHRITLASFGLLFLAWPVCAQESQGRLVEDVWHAALLNDKQAGYVHNTVREIERGGKKLFRASSEMKLSLTREGRPLTLRVETGDEETPEGKVTRVFMRQYQGQGVLLDLQGTVEEDMLVVTVKGVTQMNKRVPWNDEVIGSYRQERLFQERKVRPGDQLKYVSFEPTVDTIITNRVTVKNYEEVTLPGGKKQRLLRVEELPDKLHTTGGDVQLPAMTTWLDQDLLPVKLKSEPPLLGTLEVYRTSRQVAMLPAQAGPDLLSQNVRLNRTIDRPNSTRSAVYRITIKGDEDPASTFVTDNRQQVEKIDATSFKLKVQAVSPGTRPGRSPTASKDFLESCFWIKSDDSQVQEYARQAIGDETDPWRRARLIERWVHNHMTVSFTEQFCPADQVARTLRGDCRQHAFLTAAMCRAAGVPSRTAIGLCYANDPKGPIMAFHMWTEVHVQGQWIPIDATRGEGHVGATHIKITDSSWSGTQSLAPLLPVLRVLDKISIEVVAVSYGR
jgi:Transglutaminase-like superfamily